MSFQLFVKEIFPSIQGEGTICMGQKQIFVRTCSCHLDCWYCDTDCSRSPEFPVYRSPGDRAFEAVKNPIAPEALASIVGSIATPDVHSVSLTGGEPLITPPAIFRDLCRHLQERGLRVYLETSGTLPERLKQVIDDVNFVCMDIKLPSHGGRAWWDEHAEFLWISRVRPTCVKVVVCPSDRDLVAKAASVVAGIDPATDFVLQPETRHLRSSEDNTWLWPLWEAASQHLKNVYVVPQTHTFLKLK